jgi:hypothetical protein
MVDHEEALAASAKPPNTVSAEKACLTRYEPTRVK